MSRAQSHVVGVAVLLGVTVASLGLLTASIGAVVQSNAAAADAARVARGLDRAIDPVATTGVNRGRVSFTEGRLYTVRRDVRVLNASGEVASVRTGGLVFEAGDRRVAYVAGAVVRGGDGGSRVFAPPPITASRDSGGVLVVGAPRLNATGVAVGASGPTTVVVRTRVTHDRRSLGNGTYRVAVETVTPGAWARFFRERNATVTATDRDVDGDGVASVVARFPGERVAYLVVHDARLEVERG